MLCTDQGVETVSSRSDERVEDAVILARAVNLLLQRRDAAAETELLALSLEDPIPKPIVTARSIGHPRAESRPPVQRQTQAMVFKRDRWRCSYCGRKLVVAGVIELIGSYCPEQFPFPPGHHMPAKLTHPAANRIYPNVDHLQPWSHRGSWSDLSNLVTACTPCNESKSDRLGWETQSYEADDWNGLVECYRALAERNGVLRRYHVDWLRALGA